MIAPELIQTAEQKSQACSIPRNSWDGYAILLRYLSRAVERLPTCQELAATDAESIDRLFVTEITYLAAMISKIFEGEGIEELASYLYEPIHFT
jgi:hypothetical protein